MRSQLSAAQQAVSTASGILLSPSAGPPSPCIGSQQRIHNVRESRECWHARQGLRGSNFVSRWATELTYIHVSNAPHLNCTTAWASMEAC